MMLWLPTETDYPDLLRMARSFHEASPYVSLEFSEPHCRALFDKYLSDKRDVIFIRSSHGMIIGFASQAPFSTDRVSTEVCWWVDPEGRGKRESLLLLEAYEAWSSKVGCKLCQVAMLPSVTDLSKFYEKRGYKLLEQSYVKELN